MSRVSQAAFSIEAILEALPAFADIDVVYDRQKDIAARAKASVEKSKGLFVTILFAGKKKATEGIARWRAIYLVQVWGRPIKLEGDTPLDDIVEAIEVALDGQPCPGSSPDGLVDHVYQEMDVRDVGLIPDPVWLKYGIEVEVPLQT